MKKVLAILLVLVMVFALASCGGGSDKPKDEVVQVAICHIASEADPLHEGWLYLKDLLEKESNGKFQVTVYGNKSIAGSDVEAAEKVQQNIVQLTSTPAYAPASLGNVAGYKVFDYPYLFETNEEIYKFLETDAYGKLVKELESATGVRAIGGYSIGWLAFGSAKKAVEKPADFKGLKIRTMSTDIQMDIVNSLGGAATPVSYGELYTACQQGTVDGLMTSTGLCVSDRFYEVCKNFVFPEASANVHIVLINGKWYDGLSDELKGVFDSCFTKFQAKERELQDAFNADAIAKIKAAGCATYVPTAEEKAQWKQILDVVYTDYPDAAGTGYAAEVKKALGK